MQSHLSLQKQWRECCKAWRILASDGYAKRILCSLKFSKIVVDPDYLLVVVTYVLVLSFGLCVPSRTIPSQRTAAGNTLSAILYLIVVLEVSRQCYNFFFYFLLQENKFLTPDSRFNAIFIIKAHFHESLLIWLFYLWIVFILLFVVVLIFAGIQCRDSTWKSR